MFTSSPVDLELNRDFNGEDYEYEDEAKLVIFPDHFEIPLPNIEELPALVSELLLHGLCVFPCISMGGVHSVVLPSLNTPAACFCLEEPQSLNPFICLGLSEPFMAEKFKLLNHFIC